MIRRLSDRPQIAPRRWCCSLKNATSSLRAAFRSSRSWIHLIALVRISHFFIEHGLIVEAFCLFRQVVMTFSRVVNLAFMLVRYLFSMTLWDARLSALLPLIVWESAKIPLFLVEGVDEGDGDSTPVIRGRSCCETVLGLDWCRVWLWRCCLVLAMQLIETVEALGAVVPEVELSDEVGSDCCAHEVGGHSWVFLLTSDGGRSEETAVPLNALI